jgi:hypothetical protein
MVAKITFAELWVTGPLTDKSQLIVEPSLDLSVQIWTHVPTISVTPTGCQLIQLVNVASTPQLMQLNSVTMVTTVLMITAITKILLVTYVNTDSSPLTTSNKTFVETLLDCVPSSNVPSTNASTLKPFVFHLLFASSSSVTIPLMEYVKNFQLVSTLSTDVVSAEEMGSLVFLLMLVIQRKLPLL